jgi:hypothetical protein
MRYWDMPPVYGQAAGPGIVGLAASAMAGVAGFPRRLGTTVGVGAVCGRRGIVGFLSLTWV